MPRKIPNHCVYGSDTMRELIEADDLTLQEVAAELDPECGDWLLNAWRRSGWATIRRARGH
jgi:hypothetical protein